MLRKLFVTIAVAALPVAFDVAPSSADPRAAAVLGTLYVTPGLWDPVGVFCPGAPACAASNSSWSISAPGVSLSGSLSGYCGLSNGNGGGTVSDHAVTITRWVGVGGTITLTGTSPGHSFVVLRLQVVRNPGVACITHAATGFTVIGDAMII